MKPDRYIHPPKGLLMGDKADNIPDIDTHSLEWGYAVIMRLLYKKIITKDDSILLLKKLDKRLD